VSATQSFSVVFDHDNVRVLDIDLAADATLALHGTNYYTFNATNRSSDGTGTDTLLASAVTTATGGTAITAYIPYSLAPDQNQELSKGDVLSIEFTLTGTAAMSNPCVTILYREGM